MSILPNRVRAVAGVVGGIIGGLMMSAFSMSLGLLSGSGPWMSVKLIGGVVLGPRAINNVGEFDPQPVIGGLVIHFIVSAVLGTIFGILMTKLPGVVVTLWGAVYALIIWFIGLFFVLPKIDPLLVNNTNPAIFALAHIIYGGFLGAWVSRQS